MAHPTSSVLQMLASSEMIRCKNAPSDAPSVEFSAISRPLRPTTLPAA